MGYWDRTDEIIRNNGGLNPICQRCGQEMFPQDDHGRFICSCNFGGGAEAIPQTRLPEGETDLSDEEKEKIHPLNRLHLLPTERESAIFAEMLEDLGASFKIIAQKKQ